MVSRSGGHGILALPSSAAVLRESATIPHASFTDAPPQTEPPFNPTQVLAIVCVCVVLSSLDLFIVNVALPNIAQDFPGTGLEKLSWILNGYAIVYAALLVFFGRLAERYRRNASFLLGIAIFTAASAACAAAGSVEVLVAFRLLQAAGAALMTPTSLGLLLATFPPERRGSAVRTWTAVGGFAAALGPLIGGLLVTASWRWIFLVNVPIGTITLIVGWWKLPVILGHDVRRPDAWGAALVTFGVGALTFGIMQTADWGWRSRGVIISLALAAILLVLFVVDCLRARNPFIDPALFRIRRFTAVTLNMAPYSAAFGAMLLSIALWMQVGWGWSAFKTGIAIAPGPFMVPVTSLLFSGRLIARFGVATVIALGVICFAGGLIWWAVVLGLEPNMGLAVVGMVLTGVGVGLTLPTMMGTGTSSLPPSSFTTGSGVLNMIRQTGLALGVAMLVAIVGAPHSPLERLAAFERAWWVTAGLTMLSLVPLLLLIEPKANPSCE